MIDKPNKSMIYWVKVKYILFIIANVYSLLLQDALCSSRSLSATIAINSELVGFALDMLTV
jgi:hypothetical protein